MSSPAFAADVVEGQMPTVISWTGGYVGIYGGYHDSRLTQSGCTGLCPTSSDGPSGGLVGLQAGYDYQLSNGVVVGGFVAVPLVRPHKTVTLGGFANFDVKPKFAILGGARVGVAIDRALPYVFVGLEYARVDTSSNVTGATPSNNHFGPALGAGVEYAFTNHLSTDLRYTFTHLQKKQYDFGGGVESYGENSHNFTIALNYRF